MADDVLTQMPRSVYILGIGGAGMSGLARLFLALGVGVSGSDAKDSRRLDALRALGATCYVGHRAEQVADVDLVVISSAIPEHNPELVAARERGIPVVHRSVALALTMRGRKVVAVAGTHGKTTTTSVLTVALQACGLDPSFAIGSELNDSGANAHLGTGDLFIVEADESDGSFLRLGSAVGIVTNVEPDHLNYWGTVEAMEQSYVDFAAGIRDRGGFVTACLDDPGAVTFIQRARAEGVRVVTYGQSEGADYRVELTTLDASRSTFTVAPPYSAAIECTIQVPGVHNVLNAAAALTTGIELGVRPAAMAEGLSHFVGTRRRFEYRGEVGGVRVFDDYAHHPTEIEATLKAARSVVGSGRLLIAFQAHHYYRTAMYLQEFGQALGLADFAVVLEIFAPGEVPIPGASGSAMADAVPLPAEDVVFEPSMLKVAEHLADRAQPGDIIMTLGPGDIGMLSPEILERLGERFDRSPS